MPEMWRFYNARRWVENQGNDLSIVGYNQDGFFYDGPQFKEAKFKRWFDIEYQDEKEKRKLESLMKYF